MSTRDSTRTAPTHDLQSTTVQARPQASRRRTHSASSLSRASVVSKRSPSPIVAFTPTPLSTENTKGVKNITRKVIKRLEGLGHLEMVDALYELDGEAETESDALDALDNEEVEKALWNSIPKTTNTVQTNGHTGLKQIPKAVAVPQKEKIDWEIPRKLLHGSIGFITLYGYIANSDVPRVMIFLWSALAIIIPADLLRFRSRRFERTYERALGFLMRESEKNSVNGVVWYILGVNFVLTFYPIDIATVAILILSWADTAASTIGRLFGSSSPRLPARLPILRLPFAPRKSLAGFLAASVTGACIAFGFWGWVAQMREGGDASWAWNESRTASGQWVGLGVVGLVAGLVSGVAEALDLGSLDDNLTLPVISGGCIYGFLKLLRIIL